MSVGAELVSEAVGTAVLVLLGCGVVATVGLTRSKGFGGGWLLINIGWGMALFAAVTVAYSSGAHLNPAVTVGLMVAGLFTQSFGIGLLYILAQLVGAFVGAVLVWLAFKQHFDAEPDRGAILGVFSTGPAIRSPLWNVVTEAIATLVFVFVIIGFANGHTPASLGAIPIAFLLIAIGAGLGGPTGYAVNPARDLGPRIAHAILPIAGKGSSDWSYSWVPVVGPLIGGTLAGLLSYLLLPVLH
jgi:glycerol uptake facilitator protein